MDVKNNSKGETQIILQTTQEAEIVREAVHELYQQIPPRFTERNGVHANNREFLTARKRNLMRLRELTNDAVYEPDTLEHGLTLSVVHSELAREAITHFNAFPYHFPHEVSPEQSQLAVTMEQQLVDYASTHTAVAITESVVLDLEE